MSDLGQPIRMKFIPSLAFRVTRYRPTTDRPLKPPGRNWAKALQKRHPELIARRVKALDWNRHKKNTYPLRRWTGVLNASISAVDHYRGPEIVNKQPRWANLGPII
jgi:hypothetical protein